MRSTRLWTQAGELVGESLDGPEPPECENCHEPLPPTPPLKERKQHIPEIAVVTIREELTCPRCGWDTVIAWRDVDAAMRALDAEELLAETTWPGPLAEHAADYAAGDARGRGEQ